MTKKQILFITSTRADYGKLKPLIQIASDREEFDVKVFVTGMHMREYWGYTFNHIMKDGFDCWPCPCDDEMASRVSDVVRGLSLYLNTNKADLMVVHGDRGEALGAATAASLRNVRIAHIEGGETSGTIDEHIRHAITKLSHFHFVSNETSAQRVRGLRENKSRIFTVGSPEVDVMIRKDRPGLSDICSRYDLKLKKNDYAILLFHPVTTNLKETKDLSVDILTAIKQFNMEENKGKKNWVVIFPNDDLGRELIFDNLIHPMKNDGFTVLPSMRHEYFISLLENCSVLVGNSSCGVRETPFLGIPSINLGSRQTDRSDCESIIQLPTPVGFRPIKLAIQSSWGRRLVGKPKFGDGKSAKRFLEILLKDDFWDVSMQKSN
jgi:UDP-N-acetylglucosamine 2-epimerase (hydrolysing)